MDVMNEETMKARPQTDGPSVNKEVERVVEGVIRDAQALRVDVSQGPLGETREMMELVQTGKIAPIPVEMRPLDQADKTLNQLREGTIVGRVVLKP